MKKIIIVEDDITVRDELTNLLNTSGYNAISVKDFSNSLNEILNSNADLVLLDINIPFVNGETLLQNIRKTSNIPVIMVTSRNSEVDEVISITYGADDYITKPYNPTILLLRISSLFKRIDHSMDNLQYKDLTIISNKSILAGKDKDIELTKNEMIIFSYLLNKQGVIVTRDELMTALWNNKEYVNENALTVNISRLRTKLNEFGYKNAIETRKGQGYILL